jgi:hypothetical protein
MFGNDDDKYAISKENAERVIQEILDFLEIDIDEIEDKELKKMIKQNYGRMIKAVRLGRLEVKTAEGFRIIQHLRNDVDHKNSLIYRAPGAQAKKAMGEKLVTDFNGRIYALMGSACGLGEAAIDKLDPVDLSLLEVLGAIFLSA